MDEKAEYQSDSLNKLLPITVLFGNEAKGSLRMAHIVGVAQSEDNHNHTDLKYTGRGWSGHAGMSVRTKELPVSIRDVFNVLTEAHKAGKIADLTDEAIEKNGLKYEKPKSPETSSGSKGWVARMFG